MFSLLIVFTVYHQMASIGKESLPEYMKSVYMVFYETVNELAREAEKSQGRDTLNYARQAVCIIILKHYTYISFS